VAWAGRVAKEALGICMSFPFHVTSGQGGGEKGEYGGGVALAE
jgi:hypothetical protein